MHLHTKEVIMYIEKLSDEKILTIAKKATIDHFPKEWHANISYEILDGENKRVRKEPEKFFTYDGSLGSPIARTLPTHKFYGYAQFKQKLVKRAEGGFAEELCVVQTTKEMGYAYIKAELKQPEKEPLKIGYMYIDDNTFEFFNFELFKEEVDPDYIIAEDWLQLCHGGILPNKPEAQNQREQSKKIFKQEIANEFADYAESQK